MRTQCLEDPYSDESGGGEVEGGDTSERREGGG
jgi:hypothetical protein